MESSSVRTNIPMGYNAVALHLSSTAALDLLCRVCMLLLGIWALSIRDRQRHIFYTVLSSKESESRKASHHQKLLAETAFHHIVHTRLCVHSAVDEFLQQSSGISLFVMVIIESRMRTGLACFSTHPRPRRKCSPVRLAPLVLILRTM